MLPSRFAVKRLACDQAIEVKAYLAQAVNNAIKENGIIGMTLNMWSDIKQRHYLGITVHLISNGKLISATLSVHEFPHQVKSGNNIISSIRQICESLGIPQHVLCNQLYFVTDQGSNVRAALSTFHRFYSFYLAQSNKMNLSKIPGSQNNSMFHRFPCACHIIATAVRNILLLDEQKEVSLLDNDDEPLKAAVSSVVTACNSNIALKKAVLAISFS